MSTYSIWEYPSVVRAIRRYPVLLAAKAARQGQSVTAAYGPQGPHAHGARRATEDAVLRGLSAHDEQWVDAITGAIEEIRRHRDGSTVLAIVEMVDFERRYTLAGAAQVVHVSERTAQRQRGRFIRCVARRMGIV